MNDTLNPEEIHDVFFEKGFIILRIDKFHNGKSAKIRAELDYGDELTTNDLQDIALKLKTIEKNENIVIDIIHIDMNHKSIRLNFNIV
jgi:hypothetical protein